MGAEATEGELNEKPIRAKRRGRPSRKPQRTHRRDEPSSLRLMPESPLLKR